MSPTERIRAKAREIGFTKVGIARAGPLDEEGQHLAEWLARGYHASMRWMERKGRQRTDPAEIVPGARSVLAVALNYYTPVHHQSDGSVGKISRYAWGDDYHGIMLDRLHQLWRWMCDEFPGIDGRTYVDTGPVMEKAWAQRSGIGWVGKHTNLITADYGSWVFLGEIITTLELDADPPATDHCGTCSLCIEACPTQAIVEPYLLDANRCISYLTIEHRGEIGPEFAGRVEGWIYGCDICQDVCPWNEKFSQPSTEETFAPRPWNRSPNLEEWSKMSQEEFLEKFRGSAVKRTKREGLLRNVRLAAGPGGGEEESGGG